MYKQHKTGKFRSRVSFDLSPELITHVNAICSRDKLSFSAVCTKAIEDYVKNQGLTGSYPLPELAA